MLSFFSPAVLSALFASPKVGDVVSGPAANPAGGAIVAKLSGIEQPDPALDRRMKEAFNSGFALRRAEHPGCTRASRIAEAAAARKGQALAARLSDVTYRLDPREAAAERAAEDQAPLRPGLP